jgi:hypothetical protein
MAAIRLMPSAKFCRMLYRFGSKDSTLARRYVRITACVPVGTDAIALFII